MGKGKGWIIAVQGAPPNLVIQIRPWATRRGARSKMTERDRGEKEREGWISGKGRRQSKGQREEVEFANGGGIWGRGLL